MQQVLALETVLPSSSLYMHVCGVGVYTCGVFVYVSVCEYDRGQVSSITMQLKASPTLSLNGLGAALHNEGDVCPGSHYILQHIPPKETGHFSWDGVTIGIHTHRDRGTGQREEGKRRITGSIQQCMEIILAVNVHFLFICWVRGDVGGRVWEMSVGEWGDECV